MRAAIYIRISADQTGEGLGVQRQLDDCLALADRLGWKVVRRYDDNDLSAYNGKRRPGFEAMLTEMAIGKFDSLLCWHVDRLYRSMRDLERLIETAEANRVTIKTVQGGDLDLSTSAGRMVARILGSVARQESEHTAERRKRANAQKAVAGGGPHGQLHARRRDHHAGRELCYQLARETQGAQRAHHRRGGRTDRQRQSLGVRNERARTRPVPRRGNPEVRRETDGDAHLGESRLLSATRIRPRSSRG